MKDYFRDKLKEIEAYNAEKAGGDPNLISNIRQLTNVGTLRAYIVAYLRQHPKIHQGMTLIVRQLGPGPDGLPLEIYAFSNDTEWSNYEGLQGDIFDHIFAIVSEFGLRVFQKPSGQDLEGFGEALQGARPGPPGATAS